MAQDHTQVDEVEDRYSSDGEQLPEATQTGEVARDARMGDDEQRKEEALE
jgi:hypothetical protein